MNIELNYSLRKNYNFMYKNFLMEFNDESVNFNSIIQSFIEESYLGYLSNNMNIVTEGFSEFKDKVVNFFKKIWNKFKNFVTKVINYIKLNFTSFEKYIREHRNDIRIEKPYTVSVYNYTIEKDSIDLSCVDDILNSFNSDLDKIKPNMSSEDYADIMKEYKDESYYDTIRGKILNIASPITEGDFIDMTRRKFRDGNDFPTETLVDEEYVKKIIDNYLNFNIIYKSLLTDVSKVKSLINGLISFFNKMPTTKIENDKKYVAVYKVSRNDYTVSKGEETKYEFDSTYIGRITAFYRKQASISKKLIKIFTIAFNIKLKSIEDSQKTYKKIIKNGLNPFNEITDSVKEKKKDNDKKGSDKK